MYFPSEGDGRDISIMNERSKQSKLPYQIDELDLKLVSELENDARQSSREIAAKLGTTATTVSRRLQRLLDAKLITIATIPIPSALGYKMVAYVGVNIHPGKSHAVIDFLRPHKNVRVIRLISGRFDILLSVLFRNLTELSTFIREELGNTPYLVHAETMIVLKRTKSSWTYLSSSPVIVKDPRPRELDELDLRLIRELEKHPRESIKNLAAKLGMSRIWTSRKLQALLDDNIIKVVSIVKPPAFGLNVEATIFVKVHPGKVTELAASLAPNTSISHVFIINGQFDLLLFAVFRDASELSDFLANDLGNKPGVISYETALQLALPKQNLKLVS